MEKVEEKGNFYFKFFIIAIMANFLISDIGFILNYSTIKGITFISKVSSIIIFALSFMYIIVTGKIKFFSQSCVLMIFFMISLLVGSIKNGINIGTFSHIYSFIMPIVISSFGYYYAKEYDNSQHLKKFMYKSLKFISITEFALTIIYILLRNSGMFYANSFGAGGLIFSNFYFLANRHYKMFFLTLTGVVLSNKRSSLLIVGIGLLYYLHYISRDKFSKKMKNVILMVMASLLFVLIYKNTTYLNRFDKFFQIDFSDINSIHVATSYRTLEIEYVIKFLKENMMNFLFGGGFGSQIFNGFKYVRYIHFSPLNYAFISGVPFALLMYLLFFIDTINMTKKKCKKFLWINISWIAYLVLTFTAATVSTHILTWFVLGGLKYSNKVELKE